MSSYLVAARVQPITIDRGCIVRSHRNDEEQVNCIVIPFDANLPKGAQVSGWADILMSDSSTPPVLVFAYTVADLAFYLAFNPLDAEVRPLLDTVRKQRRLDLVMMNQAQDTLWCPVEGDMFQKVWPRTVGRPAPRRDDWLRMVHSLMPGLPGTCNLALPTIRGAREHRGFVMEPAIAFGVTPEASVVMAESGCP